MTQPPLACQLSKDKEIDLFSYQFILKTGLRIEQMNDKADLLIYPYQEVSQKLGLQDVDASSSRTQLKCSATFGLSNKLNLSLSLSTNLGKKKALQYQAFKNKPDI